MENFKISHNKKIKESQLKIKKISNSISNSDLLEFTKLIDFFNLEYKWPEMFTIQDVNKRIENKETAFLLFYKNTSIGYVWFKTINENTCFGYNLYVTKKEKRPAFSPYWFYKNVTDYMLIDYDTIHVEVNEWNYAIIDIIKSIGYYK